MRRLAAMGIIIKGLLKCKITPLIEFDPISEERQKLKEQFICTIGMICSGDPGTCEYGFCKKQGKCADKHRYIIIYPLKKIKHLQCVVDKAERKLKHILTHNKKHPINQKQLFEQARFVLGQDIFEHELVTGDLFVIARIKCCESMRAIGNVLEEKYNAINEKRILLPGGGRYRYWKYLNENNPKLNKP